jgi:hypothetical protein
MILLKKLQVLLVLLLLLRSTSPDADERAMC